MLKFKNLLALGTLGVLALGVGVGLANVERDVNVANAAEGDKYTLVTDVSQLEAGKVYAIGDKFCGVVMSSQSEKNYRLHVNTSFESDNSFLYTDGMAEFVLGGDAENGWTFYDEAAGGYLEYHGSSNELYTKEEGNIQWDVSFDASQKVTIKNKGFTSVERFIRFNDTPNINPKRFACYKPTSSGMKTIQLFVKSGAIEVVPVSSIVFGQENPTLKENEELQMTATVNEDATNKKLIWSLSDVNPEGCATIDSETGLVKAMKTGTANIVATAADSGAYSASTTLTITEDKIQSLHYEGTPTLQHVGSPFNANGLTFYVLRASGQRQDLTADQITFSPEVMDLETSAVTATYEGVSVEISGFKVSNATKYYFADGTDEGEGFQGWDSSYAERTLTYDHANVVWSGANKQASKITNMPVSKACTTTITSTKEIISIEVGFKQWTTKTQTINLSVNGESVSTLNFPNQGTTISWSSSDVRTNEIVINTTLGNQIGWEYFAIELGEDMSNIYATEATTWSKHFNSTMVGICDASGNTNFENLNTAWTELNDEFTHLADGSKELLKNATLDGSTNADIKAAVELYDYIFAKYNSQLTAGNFINRATTAISAPTTDLLNNQTNLIIIVVISVLSVSAISFFVISKRKSIAK